MKIKQQQQQKNQRELAFPHSQLNKCNQMMGDEINQPSVPSELGSCSPDPPGNACLPSPHHYPTLPLGKANPYLQSKWTEYVTRRQFTSRNGQSAEPAPTPNLPCQPPFIIRSWFYTKQRSLWRQRPNISFPFCILLLPPGVRRILSFAGHFPLIWC